MTSWAWKAAPELGVEVYWERSGCPRVDEEPRLVQGPCEQDGAGGRKATSRCVKSLGTRSWNGETEVGVRSGRAF